MGYLRWWVRKKAEVTCNDKEVKYEPDEGLGWNLMSYGKFGRVLTKHQKARAMCFADRTEGLKNIFGELINDDNIDDERRSANASSRKNRKNTIITRRDSKRPTGWSMLERYKWNMWTSFSMSFL